MFLKPLEVRNGVSPSRVYLPEGAYSTVLDFLELRFSRGTRLGWERRMIQGRVFDQHGIPIAPDSPYTPRCLIFYYRELQEESLIPFVEKVIYEDEHIVVADKPHFLPVTPIGPYIQETLLVRLRNRLGHEHLSAVHRLDLETAGLVLFTKQVGLRNTYAALFREQAVKKIYQAIAPYQPSLSLPIMRSSRIERAVRFMQMQEVLGQANAHTLIRILDQYKDLARYQLEPRTGKKHQLRVHMSALGVPILNDHIYPVLQEYIEPSLRTYNHPLQLLAQELHFTDPITSQRQFFQSSYTLDFPVTR
ncbi:MAG: pseudouridine synthase [Betaproteobacteria bacterium]|jgi:tRNA pseudouridine32 synthase / 23S rRNA pseudouridine746 synthase|nr:pseudouridine synthase [Polynucleobacter sp.]NBY62782.1 pseudouridine synthase [Betaproteobacteria bacterium]